MEIVPSILTNSPDELREKIALAEGVVKKIQIDIVDGVFAGNKTVDPQSLENVETNLKIDFHLMAKEPVSWVERCVRGGAESVIGQVEKMGSQLDFVAKCQEVGCQVGLALDIDSPIEALDKEALADLDTVLIMSVKAGFGGQEFDSRAFKKIQALLKARENDISPFRICVDGGVTKEIVPRLAALGVNEVVVGERIFEGDLLGNVSLFLANIKP